VSFCVKKQFCAAKTNHIKMEKTKITINNNGSIKLDGDFEIVDPQGNAYGLQGRTIVSLCRCGHSANKPFCDGAHKANGFEHEPVAFDLPPKKVA
jgi:CDGSH-type Zn-finger protein